MNEQNKSFETIHKSKGTSSTNEERSILQTIITCDPSISKKKAYLFLWKDDDDDDDDSSSTYRTASHPLNAHFENNN